MIKRVKEYYLNSSIRVKINISIVGAAGIILLVLLSIVSLRSRSIVLDNAEKAATALGKENSSKAVEFVNSKESALQMMASSFEGQSGMLDMKFDLYKNTIKHVLEQDEEVYAIWYVEDFKVSDSSHVQKFIHCKAAVDSKALLARIESDFGYSQVKNTGEVWISDPVNANGTWLFDIAVPLKVDGKIVGAVGYIIDVAYLNKIVSEALDSEDGACKIITGTGLVVAHADKSQIGRKTDEGDDTDVVLERIKKNELFSDYVYSSTFKGEAYKVFVPITFDGTKYTWSFCTLVPTSKMLYETHMLALVTILLIIVGLLVLFYVTNFLSRMLTKPVVLTSEQLSLISEGRLGMAKELDIHSNDEIGQMVEALNQLTFSLKNLAHFADEVGHGNLDVNMEAKNEQDVIGKAMVEMKQNLIEAREADNNRRQEDDLRSWKITGNARIHEAIRRENTSIKQLCTAIIKEIISYTDAIQGGIFVIDDTETSDRYVDLVACIAYSRKKMLQKRMPIEEGLIGRCIYEKAPILLSEIPQDYLSITSGLGDKNPSFLAIIPLMNNEEIVGVFEIASFKEFDNHVIEYLTKAAEGLASAISNVKINERTQRLLDQTKQYAEEMGAQEEELRQNMEEMQAAQEEMYRKSKDYEDTIARLKDELAQKM